MRVLVANYLKLKYIKEAVVILQIHRPVLQFQVMVALRRFLGQEVQHGGCFHPARGHLQGTHEGVGYRV